MQEAQQRPIIYDVIPPELVAGLRLVSFANGQVGHIFNNNPGQSKKIIPVTVVVHAGHNQTTARVDIKKLFEEICNDASLTATEIEKHGGVVHTFQPVATVAHTVPIIVTAPIQPPAPQFVATAAKVVYIPKALHVLPVMMSLHPHSAVRVTHTSRRRLPKIFIGLILFMFSAAGAFGIWHVERQTVSSSEQAFARLQSALAYLKDFKFKAAADDFTFAQQQLAHANGIFDIFGASLLSSVQWLPGARTVGSAHTILVATEKLATAGALLANAAAEINDTNLIRTISTVDGGGSRPPLNIVADLQKAVKESLSNVSEAKVLLNNADLSAVPESKRALVASVRDRLPAAENYLKKAVTGTEALAVILGAQGKHTYMLLFENNSELRPSGGFPGSFALVTFENGHMISMRVDDVYNVDGQLKERIIPPPELQHITPILGMRDAGWFADFAVSARRFMSYYRKDTTEIVDGVIAVTPDVIAKMLDVVGPIPMPEYGVVLNGDNFLAQVQDVVEYRGDRSQPKKILKDFQPLFLKKLQTQDKEQWYHLSAIVLAAVRSKHLLAYFDDQKPQQLVESFNAGGRMVLDADSDFLNVTFVNVKGFKTDAVTDNEFMLDVALDGATASHTLAITRTHRGAERSEPFYTKDNTAYIRVYAPAGSLLRHVEGDSVVQRKPLLDYSASGYVNDPEILALQASLIHPLEGIDQFEEAGATVFGFWLVVKPGESKTVTVQYDTPTRMPYKLRWQKQPGTGDDAVQITLRGLAAAGLQSSTLTIDGSTARWVGTLTTDKELTLQNK